MVMGTMKNRESKAAELANHSSSYGAGVLPPLPCMPTGVPHNFVSVDIRYTLPRWRMESLPHTCPHLDTSYLSPEPRELMTATLAGPFNDKKPDRPI